jgi:hypothetical protein
VVDLFGGGAPAAPKRTAKRAAKPPAIKGKTSKLMVVDEIVVDAPAIERTAPVMTPEEYEASWTELIGKISTPDGARFARAHWGTEEKLRTDIGVELKAVRMLKASLDGRCNRIIAGIIPAGKD